MDAPPSPAQTRPPRWQPIPAIDRRVLGVLVEKAKTTPDAYPMTLNSICTACNQKNNRFPLMNVEPDDVEPALDRLRNLGAVAIVQGSGRVDKYRHYMYEWLGVDKVELAVMTELLLRGSQTEGELRGRAARMEPIADLTALRPVLESLKAKGLLISLTSEGRGHVVTHALYEPRELEKQRAEFSSSGGAAAPAAMAASKPLETMRQETVPHSTLEPVQDASPLARAAGDSAGWEQQMRTVRSEVAMLRGQIDELSSQLERCRAEIDQLKSSLGI